MRRFLHGWLAAALIVSVPAFAGDQEKDKDKKKLTPAEQRAEIDQMAKETLAKLFEESEDAKSNYDKAKGYAVFDNTRVTVLIGTGGGGTGVAVDKDADKRTYMKMGTGGLALGVGAQKYQVILLFETTERLQAFIEKGWKAESGANAAAGTEGANVGTQFIDGIAVYQITEAGLMASADISGTKYSVDKKLNE